MRPYTASVVVGPRYTGKSVIISNLLRALTGVERHGEYSRIGRVYIISNTEPETRYYSRWMNCMEFVSRAPRKGLLKSIIRTQIGLFNKKDSLEVREQKKKRHSLCIVFDDITYDPKALKSKAIRWLFMNGRHYGFCIILGIQYCIDMPTGIRGNVDYVFSTRDSSIENTRKLYKNFYGVFENFQSFKKIYERNTLNHHSIVIDKTVGAASLTDIVFRFLAEYHTSPSMNFRCGSINFQKMCDRLNREQEMKDLEKQRVANAKDELLRH